MSVAIVGGGITGLSAAFALAQRGREAVLIEPGTPGGLLRTERVDGFLVECGADSWIRAKPDLRDLARELGLANDLLPSNTAGAGTAILRNGHLVPLPEGMRTVAPTRFGPLFRSPILKTCTKLHNLSDLIRRPATLPERSVAELVTDHFGSETLEYIAEPLFAGVYGGIPEKLSAWSVLPKAVEHERIFGSLIRGARREPAPKPPIFESLRHGLGSLPAVLMDHLSTRIRWIRAEAEAVEPGRVRVAGEWLDCSHTILACGALPASRLLAGTPAGGLLGQIEHSSATIFAFGFESEAFAEPPRGFGFLVPRRERQTILAATWVTNKFPGRAPENRVLVRCFVSGNRDEEAAAEVLADLSRIAYVKPEPLFTRVYRWPDSLPQFHVGHIDLVKRIEAALPERIIAAGAFLGAVGMPDCARSGANAAARCLP